MTVAVLFEDDGFRSAEFVGVFTSIQKAKAWATETHGAVWEYYDMSNWLSTPIGSSRFTVEEFTVL